MIETWDEEINVMFFGITDKNRKLSAQTTLDLEVEGYSWQEDMHPDGIGYYETFYEANEDSYEDAVNHWLEKANIIDFNDIFADLLEEDENIEDIVDYKIL